MFYISLCNINFARLLISFPCLSLVNNTIDIVLNRKISHIIDLRMNAKSTVKHINIVWESSRSHTQDE